MQGARCKNSNASLRVIQPSHNLKDETKANSVNRSALGQASKKQKVLEGVSEKSSQEAMSPIKRKRFLRNRLRIANCFYVTIRKQRRWMNSLIFGTSDS